MPQGILHGFSTVSHQIRNKKNKNPLEHAVNKASELSKPHLSTRLCNSSLCVSMLCFETVLVCIVTMLTNCGPFNRRSIDQIFGIVPSVNSLALYLLDDPLFVGSFEFSSQPLFEEELVAH
jgi:hypothetical protein